VDMGVDMGVDMENHSYPRPLIKFFFLSQAVKSSQKNPTKNYLVGLKNLLNLSSDSRRTTCH
jgi:hypothetical protein